MSGQSETLGDSKICIFFANTRFSYSLNLKKRFALFCSPEKKIEVLLPQKVDK